MNELSSPMTDENKGEPTHLWRRWTVDAEVPFYLYCAIMPSEEATEDDDASDAELGLLRRARQRLELFYRGFILGEFAASEDDGPPRIRYCRGRIRFMLRHTPLFVSLAILGTLVEAEFRSDIYGVSDFVVGAGLAGSIGLGSVLTGLGLLFVPVILIWLLKKSNIFGLAWPEIARFVFIYGLVLVLGSGIAFSLYTVLTDGTWNPTNSNGVVANVAFRSGIYLLMVIDGFLVYDWILRLENLFSYLPEKQDSPVSTNDSAAYSEFVSDFKHALDRSLPIDGWIPFRSGEREVSAALLFSAVFVGSFVISGPVRDGWYTFTGVVYTAFDLILVVVFFQFLVTVLYFHRLLKHHAFERYNDATQLDYAFDLTLRPAHPDGFAGFQDIGKFAMRVNSMIFIGGLYLVYRVYLGVNHLPESGLMALNVDAVSWWFQHLGPTVVYILAVVVWLRFSFWQIHQTMARDKAVQINDFLKRGDDVSATFLQIHRAPVWPVNVQAFAGMISADLIPLLLLSFVPPS